MLLEFRTSNYKSFKEELVFSLVPTPKQKLMCDKVTHKNLIGSQLTIPF